MPRRPTGIAGPASSPSSARNLIPCARRVGGRCPGAICSIRETMSLTTSLRPSAWAATSASSQPSFDVAPSRALQARGAQLRAPADGGPRRSRPSPPARGTRSGPARPHPRPCRSSVASSRRRASATSPSIAGQVDRPRVPRTEVPALLGNAVEGRPRLVVPAEPEVHEADLAEEPPLARPLTRPSGRAQARRTAPRSPPRPGPGGRACRRGCCTRAARPPSGRSRAPPRARA